MTSCLGFFFVILTSSHPTPLASTADTSAVCLQPTLPTEEPRPAGGHPVSKPVLHASSLGPSCCHPSIQLELPSTFSDRDVPIQLSPAEVREIWTQLKNQYIKNLQTTFFWPIQNVRTPRSPPVLGAEPSVGGTGTTLILQLCPWSLLWPLTPQLPQLWSRLGPQTLQLQRWVLLATPRSA